MHENWGGCDEYAPSQVERNEIPFDWLCQEWRLDALLTESGGQTAVFNPLSAEFAHKKKAVPIIKTTMKTIG
jgi:hypothetical protein